MAKFKQECIFGIRAVMEAIQDEKEIDKVMFRQGIKGELFQQLFSLVRERQIQFQYVPEEVFKPFAGKNHQGVLAEVSPIPYQDINTVVDAVVAEGEMPLILILDRITDVRNLGGIARTAECAGVSAILIPNKNSAKISSDANICRGFIPFACLSGEESQKDDKRIETKRVNFICSHGESG